MTARVVSLVPSVTETLLSWSVVPVAVTRFCEQPDLPAVGGTKDPAIDAITALAPDLVVVDREENRKEDADALTAAGVPVHVTAVRSFDDVAPTLTELRRVIGLGPEPPDSDEDTVGTERKEGAPRVWVPIWRRPWMSISARTYGSSLLERCGAVNVLGDHPDPYPTVTPEEIAVLRPDAVLAPSEPYPWAERHRDLFSSVAPMVLVDGRDLFWWGARTPGAVGRLSAVLADLAGTLGR